MARKKYHIPDQKSVTYGVSAEEIALICQVSFRTACRWKSGATEMPATSKMVLAGDLGFFDPDWTGWVLRCGKLISPEGWEATPGHVRAMRFHEALVRELRTENRSLREALDSTDDQVEDQPLPHQWEYKAG